MVSIPSDLDFAENEERIQYYVRLNQFGRKEVTNAETTFPNLVDLLIAAADNPSTEPIDRLNIPYELLRLRPNLWTLEIFFESP